MSTRKEGVVSKDNVAVLPSQHGFVTIQVMYVPAYPFRCVLDQTRIPRHLGRPKGEHSLNTGGSKRNFGVLKGLKPKDLLSDQDFVAVLKLHGVPKSKVHPIDASEIPEDPLAVFSADPRVAAAEIGIVGEHDLPLAPADIRGFPEWERGSVRPILENRDQTGTRDRRGLPNRRDVGAG
ncbi:MAG: hypothetical protein AAGE52_00095 [Myxococcota bacterium]